MSDSSQTWCMVPTELASDCATQAPAAVDESNTETMTELTNVCIEGEKDETYYWDTVKFSVEGTGFKVPRYQFVIGSTYFAGKLESTKMSDNEGDEAPISLEGATASQFRVLLKLLFPIHTTSTTLKFSKEEWLIVLELSTLWDFHEFRKLAKEHLEPQLDPIERIVLGRAAYIPKWVLDGYETLVTRSGCISEQESERIGHLTTVRLYILRHERCFDPESFASRFGEEIHALEQRERDHMSAEEKRTEEEKRLEEETQRRDREEQQRLQEEKARAEREEEERKGREEMEDRERREARRKAEEGRLEQERVAENRKREEEEERRRKEQERLQKEANELIHKQEALRLEEERIAREFAELDKQEEAQRKIDEAQLEQERLEQERVQEERKRKEEKVKERRRREEERLRKEADERIRKKEEELRLEEERVAKELADLEKQEEEARLQEEREREKQPEEQARRAGEREEGEQVQKAERERLQQQSKPPSLGGFGSKQWGGKASSSLWAIPSPVDAGGGWGRSTFGTAGGKKKTRG